MDARRRLNDRRSARDKNDERCVVDLLIGQVEYVRAGRHFPFSCMSPRRELCRRLEAQMLQWGQDVRSPHGNLLAQHGFHRWRQPELHRGSSRYRLAWRDRVVELHGFCAGLYGGGRPGFIYVRARNHVRVYLGQDPPVPGQYSEDLLASDLDPAWRGAFAAARDEFLDWMEQYLAWRRRFLAAACRPLERTSIIGHDQEEGDSAGNCRPEGHLCIPGSGGSRSFGLGRGEFGRWCDSRTPAVRVPGEAGRGNPDLAGLRRAEAEVIAAL